MEDRRRQMLKKWLERKQSELQAMVLGYDDASEWCRDEADIIGDHIKTLDVLIHVNETLKASLDAANAEADKYCEQLQQSEWLLVEAKVQLEEGKAKTRHNRADLIDQFLTELKGEK